MGTWKHRLSNIDLEAKTAICQICGPTRLKVYSKNSKKKGRCRQAYKKQKASTRMNRREANFKKLTAFKAGESCERCGFDEHPSALDLHHVDPNEKERSIKFLISAGYGWDRIQDEIDKCIILCANCHRIHHSS